MKSAEILCLSVCLALLLCSGTAFAAETPAPAAPSRIELEVAVASPTPEPAPTPEPEPTPEPVPTATPEPTRTPANKWEALKMQYADDEQVQELIFVQYQGGSTAHLELWQKNEEAEDGWAMLLGCRAHVGMNGIDKKKEGDKRTPTGDFGVLTAFGIKGDPGTALPYFKVTSDMYCCADKEFYNKIVSRKEMHHKCTGEHLINYKPCYYYCMFLDYNAECEYGKGSAIFMHCYGSKVYTGGCVAVTEKNMKTILTSVHPGVRVCIYRQ